MNKFIFLFLLLGLLLFGCTQNEQPVISPQDQSTYSIIQLPLSDNFTLEQLVSVVKNIDGSVGGIINLSHSYIDLSGNLVTMNAELRIPSGAFSDSINILMQIDDEYAAAHFEPAMTFNKDLEFDLEFTGLDVAGMGLTSGNVDFVFIDDNGNIELIDKNAIHVIKSQGMLLVKSARIPHFSRFGFIKKSK
jgi:hypothetical protein